MSTWKASFEQKVREVDLYLAFVDGIVERSGKVHFAHRKTWRNRRVEEDVQRVLKAGIFLMLYNLVESSIRAGLLEICEALKIDGVAYKHAHQQIRNLWIRENFVSLEKSFAQPSSYRLRAMEIIEKVLNEDIVAFSEENFPLSGNIDARKVREIAELYGFSAKTNKLTKGGEKFEIVKKLRNALAHGDISFSECGRDHTVAELKEIRKQVVWYLRNILKNVERYIQDKKFRAA